MNGREKRGGGCCPCFLAAPIAGVLFSALLGIGTVGAQPAPELLTGWTTPTVIEAKRELVVAAHPRAAEAGAAILAAGGNAIDAAIAAQLVLNVVEPQSSGLGGGAFLLYYDAQRARLVTYDGRETAPAAAREDLFLAPDGRPIAFVDALIGGRAVGAPGVAAMLALAHRRHGRHAWPALFTAAIALTRDGFPISDRLARSIAADRWLAADPAARALFFDSDGTPLAAGAILRNARLAEVFEAVARDGAGAMTRGPIAAAIVASVRDHPRNPGLLTLDDLARYRPIERAPVCAPYKRFRICGMGPSSSGGVTVVQLLKLLEHRPMAPLPADGLMAAHLYAEASRLAYADRDRYIADPAFVSVPVRALVAPAYLRDRGAPIDARRSLGIAAPGRVGPAPMLGAGQSLEAVSTTHLTVVDRFGNIAALSSTIESAFGARLMAHGLLLNNQLTDFSFAAIRDGMPIANAVASGKRPRSAVSPTIVFDARNRPILALGSAGGPWIIGHVARALQGVLDHGLTLQQAFERPHVANRNGVTELERGTTAEALGPGLELLGHRTRVMPMTSGLHGIERTARGTWRSGIDPRREGGAAGR